MKEKALRQALQELKHDVEEGKNYDNSLSFISNRFKVDSNELEEIFNQSLNNQQNNNTTKLKFR
jgi:hypothetical protein